MSVVKETLQIDASAIADILGTVGSPLIVVSELIKNAIDASANTIRLTYDRDARSIAVFDDGHGFTLDDIQQLSRPGFSRKKVNGNLTNAKGLFYTGSKGLGLLSVFSLCESITIQTTSDNDGEYLINWYKDSGSYSYEKVINAELHKGTRITLNNVPQQVLALLTSQAEIKKLRHISTYLYKNKVIDFPEITLEIDGSPPASLLFTTEFNDMLFDVVFSYDKESETLNFQCISKDGDINDSVVTITSFDTLSIESILDKYYSIIETIKTRTNDNISFKDLENVEGVPSFEGRLLVYEKKTAGGMLKDHGAGVNIYVNDFAMYNYLSEELDWLGLADFSQRKKVTRLKPHNVFGFVNLPYFDESKEQLKISNERADFIQDTVFVKLMYLIKGVIMFMILNIDVAKNNPKYKRRASSSTTSNSSSDSNSGANNQLGTNVEVNNGEDRNSESHLQLEEPDENNNSKEGKQSNKEFDDSANKDDTHENTSNKDVEDDQEDSYEPETVFKPQHKKRNNLTFTSSEGQLFDSLKNTDDLGNKIYQTVCELSKLNVLFYPYATVCLYRTLLESATQYASKKLGLQYQETALPSSITNVLNKWGATPNTSKEFKSNVGLWRDLINKRSLLDKLNLYIHNVTPVDVDLILDTWKSMKGYIRECIK
ncbi:ATP-binding protein [Paenibacillus phoenicis]|uniref:ATP-binding protein n=1 Tax=Paenibacillus phoenicis TaxID=554117 RepID=A0ABU5PQ50_9BACL|nr:ATP-binding protein [Paenibacillus phoenicis]MEA3572031.1 ATP-binding protein [Paenibacillus phoenicis]